MVLNLPSKPLPLLCCSVLFLPFVISNIKRSMDTAGQRREGAIGSGTTFGSGGANGGSGLGADAGNALFSEQSYSNPTQAGAAGGDFSPLSGGRGGGVVEITLASGPLTVLGAITADGAKARTRIVGNDTVASGAGAGGSIAIRVETDGIAGTGRISADGGSAGTFADSNQIAGHAGGGG